MDGIVLIFGIEMGDACVAPTDDGLGKWDGVGD